MYSNCNFTFVFLSICCEYRIYTTLPIKKGEIQEIEEICEKPMEALGYAKFDPKITEDQEMLTKSADEIWPYFTFDHHQLQNFKGQFEEELSNVMNGISKLP